MKWRAIWQTPKDAVYNFSMDNGFTLAAALAFYAILSIAPLLILLITVFGLVSDSTGQQIIAQTEKLIGPQASQGVELIVKNAQAQRFAATASAVTGLIILLLSATSAFGQLQSSLNAIFNEDMKSQASWSMIWCIVNHTAKGDRHGNVLYWSRRTQ